LTETIQLEKEALFVIMTPSAVTGKLFLRWLRRIP